MTETLSRAMVATAGRAAGRLGRAGRIIAGYADGLRTVDGGYRGRSRESDLYYTAFAMECLSALDALSVDEGHAAHLRSFGGGEGLGLIHLAALARCWACAGDGIPADLRGRFEANLSRWRRADGGYATGAASSVYGCYLALMAHEDAGLPAPDAGAMIACVNGLRTPDGGYANEPATATGTTTVTAAAVVLLARLGRPADSRALAWLAGRCGPDGGFRAGADAPAGDLLSTATALFALRQAGGVPAELRGRALDFVEGLWDDRGAFAASPLDLTCDIEYTFHGLLAIGAMEPAQ